MGGAAGCTVAQIHPSASHIIIINKNNNNNTMTINLAPYVDGCSLEQIDTSLRILHHHDPDHHDLDDQLVCRCGGMFCGIHRYSDKHDCTFDYGALGKSEIAAANPVIVAEKVAKI